MISGAIFMKSCDVIDQLRPRLIFCPGVVGLVAAQGILEHEEGRPPASIVRGLWGHFWAP